MYMSHMHTGEPLRALGDGREDAGNHVRKTWKRAQTIQTNQQTNGIRVVHWIANKIDPKKRAICPLHPIHIDGSTAI